MELKETVEMMLSDDYKERFRAEYYQLVIRYNKLKAMLTKWDDGRLGLPPPCSDFQVRSMSNYIAALECRAEIEGIVL